MKGKCKDCKEIKFLTRHSLSGNHKPPFIYLCRDCHDKRDKMGKPKKKIPGKYAPGTIKQHKKGWKKRKK